MSDEMIGQIISHYKILEKLAEGEMSKSYPRVEGVGVTLILKEFGALKGSENRRGIL
jgi:hypothetical protein